MMSYLAKRAIDLSTRLFPDDPESQEAFFIASSIVDDMLDIEDEDIEMKHHIAKLVSRKIAHDMRDFDKLVNKLHDEMNKEAFEREKANERMLLIMMVIWHREEQRKLTLSATNKPRF
ncbi:hypothetical protein ACPV5R_18720 [Vibrio astriarenae]